MSFIRNISILTAKERRGLIFLLLMTLLLCGIYLALPHLVRERHFNYEDFARQIAEYQSHREETDRSQAEIRSQPFNINTVSFQELMNMGLDESVAARWIKFRDAVGGFDSIAQIKKIYGIKESWYYRNLTNFEISVQTQSPGIRKDESGTGIAINESKGTGFENSTGRPRLGEEGFERGDKSSSGNYSTVNAEVNEFLADSSTFNSTGTGVEGDPVKEVARSKEYRRDEVSTLVDINQSNIYQWQLLNGIGPAYASRIVKYRDKLGGFSSVDQVGETYGLPDSVFALIRPHLTTSEIIRPLWINRWPADSLRNHPYINWKQASIIENYRLQHGPYRAAEDLFRIKVFDTVFVEQLRPYLAFDE